MSEPLRIDEGIVVPKLIIEDKEQRRRIELNTDDKGSPQMLFYDAEARLRFGVYLDRDGCAMLFLKGKEEGGARFSISEGQSGDGETMIVVTVCNAAGDTLYSFGSYKDGTPMFDFTPAAAAALDGALDKHLPPPGPPQTGVNWDNLSMN